MLTQQLAGFVVDTSIRAIPADVMQAARYGLIDTLGVALAGTIEPVSRIAQRLVEETGARRQSTIWGTQLAASPLEAAHANGASAHALDFDDSHPHVRGHASAPTIATALAVGEVAGASGAAVLAAYALGLEIAGKLGRALGTGHYMRGWHATSTVGTFSSAAVAGRLWNLSGAEMRTAFGIAGSQSSGLVRNFGTMTKPFHAGRAARAGVLAAWLAKNGHTADQAIFDGSNNVFETYAAGGGVPLAELLGGLGAPWEILEPGNWVKRWPCCYAGHRAIGGLFRLLERHQIRGDEITSIAAGFLPGSDAALICTDPHTGLEGKFSVEYMLAAAVLDRKLTLESFTDAMVQRAPIRGLMAKVRRYQVADDRTYGLDASTDIEIETVRGRFREHVEHTPGSPAWPMTEAGRTEKFMDCAARILGVDGAERLLEIASRCETLPDIRELIAETVPTVPMADANPLSTENA
jgi:2-methylcitrate dehydratase PrpD